MTITQWVNLDPDDYGKHCGRTIPLVATRSVYGRFKRSTTGTATLRQVQWAVAAVDMATGGVTPLSTAALNQAQFLDGAQTTEDNEGTFTNRLRVPPTGGIRYTVTCTGVDGHAGTAAFTRSFETWRRVHFTVHTMTPRCRRIYKRLKADMIRSLRAAYIDLVELDVLQTLLVEDGTRPGNVSVNALHGDENNDHKPHMRLVFLNTFYDLEDRVLEFDITGADGTNDLDPLVGTAAFSDDRRRLVLRLSAGEQRALPITGYFGSVSPISWTYGDQDTQRRRSYYERDTTRLDDHAVELRLGDDLEGEGRMLTSLDDGRPLHARLTLRVRIPSRTAAFVIANDSFCAAACYPDLGEAEAAAKVLKSITHEIGHQLDLTPGTSPRHYTQLGGQGPHCSLGTHIVAVGPNTPYPLMPAGHVRLPTDAQAVLCRMFAAVHDQMGDFCDQCVKDMRAANVEDIPV